jgi:hypothetical protein
MTTIAVLADPPVGEIVLPSLGEPLEEEVRVALYRAMLADVCEAIQRGGADLLVNYPSADRSSAGDPEAALRGALDGELDDPARYEVQVGGTYAGRVGNTLTHLLESEDEETVAVVEPTAILLRREHIGSAAMKLRSSEVVLGPTPDAGVYFAGFGEPVDFADAFATPAVETLTDRAVDRELSVDFLPMVPTVSDLASLRTVVAVVRARLAAGRNVPPRTAARVEEHGFAVGAGGELVRSDRS